MHPCVTPNTTNTMSDRSQTFWGWRGGGRWFGDAWALKSHLSIWKYLGDGVLFYFILFCFSSFCHHCLCWVSVCGALFFHCWAMMVIHANANYPLLLLFIYNKSKLLLLAETLYKSLHVRLKMFQLWNSFRNKVFHWITMKQRDVDYFFLIFYLCFYKYPTSPPTSTTKVTHQCFPRQPEWLMTDNDSHEGSLTEVIFRQVNYLVNVQEKSASWLIETNIDCC